MDNRIIIPAPASKSLSHRALIAAALAGGTSRLSNILESEDITRTKEALCLMGASIKRKRPGEYLVTGTGGGIGLSESETLECYVGESGTTCRFMLAIFAAGHGMVRFYGSGRLHERPVGPLAEALAALGAEVVYEKEKRRPPLLLKARGFAPGKESLKALSISAEESSQYVSGLLLAAPLADGVYLHLTGERVASWPYIGLTLDVMESFGIRFQVEVLSDLDIWEPTSWQQAKTESPGRLRFHVPNGLYRAADYQVEGDWSAASYFLAAGAIGPSPVTVSGLKHDSRQGDAVFLNILRQMGARVEASDMEVTAYPAPLRGIEVNLAHTPDLAPTMAALAAHAFGPTTLKGLENLKLKESDRIKAIINELPKVGAQAEYKNGGLHISPPEHGPMPPAENTVFSAHSDHRLAMALPLLGLENQRGSQPFTPVLDMPESVQKSFPHFWKYWALVTRAR